MSAKLFWSHVRQAAGHLGFLSRESGVLNAGDSEVDQLDVVLFAEPLQHHVLRL